MFLEVYGNSHIRKQTSAYVQSRVQTLIRLITETYTEEMEERLAKIVDVSLLKSKQRDAIEKVFLSWSESVETDIAAWRQSRLRSFYEDRSVLSAAWMALARARAKQSKSQRGGGLLCVCLCSWKEWGSLPQLSSVDSAPGRSLFRQLDFPSIFVERDFHISVE